jgi:hypothetical protein
MRTSVLLIGCVAAAASPPVYSQATMGSGMAPGPAASIRGSEMDAHDTATNPTERYLIDREMEAARSRGAAPSKLGRARPASANELSLGAVVNDKAGQAIATISSVDADGVVLSSGNLKVKVPANAFGHNNAGLLLDTTKGEFQQLITKANAAS